ncbi:hypothetical protein [Metabacillus litoralis]|uniref:hypothetical protein n=1 Tax=Metabacillus litoralis TaxID=152268 RepID=UPI001CFD775D|nr:hypothetical protein [Metabacillus litoralis]
MVQELAIARKFENAYEVAKKIYSEKITRSEGKIEINRTTGMSEGSAQAYITIFLAMMSGEEYKRAFNNETNRLFLEYIRKYFGLEYSLNALNAAQKYINYYSTFKKGTSGLQNIVNEMKSTYIIKDGSFRIDCGYFDHRYKR